MPVMKTPGVYIVEKDAFANAVVEVATAVPAFIGYTQQADNKRMSLAGKPWRISSLAEFHEYYGYAPPSRFTIAEAPAGATASFAAGGQTYVLAQGNGAAGGRFLLYHSMALFFQNGGGPCYIVSVGSYKDAVAVDPLLGGIETLIDEQEPTMILVPDAVVLPAADCTRVQQAMLMHCGVRTCNRIAILDVWGGHRSRQDPAGDCIEDFRNAVGIHSLDFAAAYYPWVHTTIVQEKDLGYENISNLDLLMALLKQEAALPDAVDDKTQAIASLATVTDPGQKALLNKTLAATSPLFNTIIGEIRNQLNLLPPAAGIAGLYTMVDNSRGVWKAPANVGMSGVVRPAVNLSVNDQQDLNVTPRGKSINAIRSFVGDGVLVWGARTLDGNSLDWRYISVRRTMIMLEESCKRAVKTLAFEPNTANTWVTIKSMISSFLTGIWKRGGLAGADPEDAFSVHVGLGETMIPEDILQGILRVTILVAVTRPAEFIEITFQQPMPKS